MTIDEIRKATEYEVHITRLKYENELRREDSLIHQAGNMQSAFSFSTAALFMAMPVMFDYRGVLSFWFIFASASSIAIILLLSLFASTMAQNRREQKVFLDGNAFIEYIENNEDDFDSEEKRNKYLAKTYAVVQESLTKSNTKRVFWVRVSMWIFYLALVDCAGWFIVAMTIIFR